MGKLDKPVSMIISNHIGWVEVLALIVSPLMPAFAAKEEIEKVPLLGDITSALQSVYIARGSISDPAVRDKVMGSIENRQKAIEDQGKPYTPICIFAEGTTTNGKYIAKFKKGGFFTLRPVQPVFVTIEDIDGKSVRPTYESMEGLALLTFFYSSFNTYKVKLTIMPPIKPSEYMFDKFRQSES